MEEDDPCWCTFCYMRRQWNMMIFLSQSSSLQLRMDNFVLARPSCSQQHAAKLIAFWTWWTQAWGLPIYVVKMALNRKRDTGLVQNAFLLLSITFVLHNVHLKPIFMPSVYLFDWCVQWVFGWTAGFIHEKSQVHV